MYAILWASVIRDAVHFLSDSNTAAEREEPSLGRLPIHRQASALAALVYDRILFDVIYYRVQTGRYPRPKRPSLLSLLASSALILLGVNRGLLFMALFVLLSATNGARPTHLFNHLFLRGRPRLLLKVGGSWVANPDIWGNLVKIARSQKPYADEATISKAAAILRRCTDVSGDTCGVRLTGYLTKSKTDGVLHLGVKGVTKASGGHAIVTDARKAANYDYYGNTPVLKEIYLEKRSSLLLTEDVLTGGYIESVYAGPFLNAAALDKTGHGFMDPSFLRGVAEQEAGLRDIVGDLVIIGFTERDSWEMVHRAVALPRPMPLVYPLTQHQLGE